MAPVGLAQDQMHEANARIDWVLAHPGTSDWLKQSLRQARGRDPVEILNDLELLGYLLRYQAEAQIRNDNPDV